MHFECSYSSTMLRAPFLVRTLANSKNALQVTWRDGVQSTFPSAWLRALVRDDRYFEASSLFYKPERLPFLAKGAPITSVELRGEKCVVVFWEDHCSEFDSSWLRAQDLRNAPTLAPKQEKPLWDGTFKIPEYDHSSREEHFESWISDLDRYGAVIIDDAPPNEKGLLSVMDLIGPVLQRWHPKDVFTMQNTAKAVEIDFYAYSSETMGAHTDKAYYVNPAKIQALLGIKYSAPKDDTVNFLVDGFKVASDLRKEHPDAFRLLSTTKARHGRHRVRVEEECAPKDRRMYEWDAYLNTPVIITDDDEVKMIRVQFAKHAGFELCTDDAKQTKEFYKAYKIFREMLNDVKYQTKFVIKPGTMVLFDNHRLLHGRGPIHAESSRVVIGGYISEEIWDSRWRLIFGKKSGLPPKWQYGCNLKSLEMLSQRISERVSGQS